ncbi:MAG: S9 family peptidase [Parvibaculaceae bacterium]|nr:S9 family peptidase [Parvibaculaceae bacterium]
MKLTPPRSAPLVERRPHSQSHHGIILEDGYGWLRDDNWREVMRDPAALKPDIRAVLEAENAYSDAAFAPLADFRETLFQEMKGRIKEDDSSVPSKDGAWRYFSRYLPGAEHPQFCRLDAKDVETLLFDGDSEAQGHAYFDIGSIEHTPDHRLIGWSADTNGSEFYTIRVRDIASGGDLPDIVSGVNPGLVWDAQGASFFYVSLDEEHRPLKVLRHVLGTPVESDELIFEETDKGFFLGIGLTQSRDFIVISTHDHATSESWVIPAGNPTAAPRLIAARRTGVEYDLEHDAPRDRFIIRTNADGAEDFKLVTAPVATSGPEHWRDLVAHREGTLLLNHATLRDHLIRMEREGGLPRIVITRLGDGAEHAVAFPEEAYDLGFSSGYEYETGTIRFTYTSMATPAEVWDYDLESRERTLRKRQEVPSGHNPADYVTRRIFATAADGEQVPISILHHKDTPLDGSAPCLLYGYGAYGISIPASFSVTRLSLSDRGFIYAIAHIRGGKERGYRWYRTGKLLQKKNSFTDFIAAGEHLSAERYTSRGQIVAHGGSAGGMLMGAVANMAPDLFLGIIADVPFVDVLTTMLDDTLPLTPPEWPEWGNPLESREAYDYIASYSPYDNVAAKAYPHIFALAGLTDPRVTYWEPAKWVAKLRALRTDERLTLLNTNMDAGHGGASGRFGQLKETAMIYAFALDLAGRS